MTEQESLARYRLNVFTSAQRTMSLIDMVLKAGPEAGFYTAEQKFGAITRAVNEHRATVDAEIEDHCHRFPDSEI